MILSHITIRPCRIMVSALFIFALTGCIPVNEIDDAWHKSKIDPALEGSWKAPDPEIPLRDTFVTYVKDGSSHQVESASAATPLSESMEGLDPPSPLARTLEFSGEKFLLMDTRPMIQFLKDARSSSSITADQQTTSPEGAIIRYTIDGDTYTQYILEEARLMKALASGEIKGTFPKPGEQTLPSLSTLDEATLQALINMKDEKEAWKSITYTRVKDVESELKKSRTYPEGSETLANTIVNVSSPAFQQLCETNRDGLMRHLQASPEWNVHQEGFDDIVAYRRETVDGGFRETSSGYHNHNRIQTRPMFRFTNSQSNITNVPHQISGFALSFKKADPVARNVALKLKKGEQGIESYLAIGKAGVWFEFFEQSPAEKRTHTRDAVNWLTDFAEDLVAASDEIKTFGYTEDLLPPNSIRQGQPQIDLIDGTLTAWLNPGRQGMVFLKVFDGETDKQIEERNYNHGGKESIGWSEKPNTLFQYRQELSHLSQVPNLSTIRIEVWFRPTDGVATPIWHEKTHPSDKRLIELVTKPPVW